LPKLVCDTYCRRMKILKNNLPANSRSAIIPKDLFGTHLHNGLCTTRDLGATREEIVLPLFISKSSHEGKRLGGKFKFGYRHA
jgi:hypothetical protein